MHRLPDAGQRQIDAHHSLDPVNAPGLISVNKISKVRNAIEQFEFDSFQDWNRSKLVEHLLELETGHDSTIGRGEFVENLLQALPLSKSSFEEACAKIGEAVRRTSLSGHVAEANQTKQMDPHLHEEWDRDEALATRRRDLGLIMIATVRF